MVEIKLPRGIRNKNPMNIRVGSKWLGLSSDTHSEREFCVFDDMRFGLRAALYLLTKYVYFEHCTTIREIVSRWAPPSENSTNNYIRSVVYRWNNYFTEIDSSYNISTLDDLYHLVYCMCTFESSFPLDRRLFDISFDLLPVKYKKLWRK